MKDKISIDLAKEWERVLKYNDNILKRGESMENKIEALIRNIQDRIYAYKDGLINDIGFVSSVTEMIDEYIEDKINDMEEDINNMREDVDKLKGMISYDR